MNCMEMDRRTSNALRGIAIIAIVLYHASGGFSSWLFGILAGPAHLGVFLFLFLSGYGICKSYGLGSIDAKNYLRKRFERVIVPYWAILTHTITGALQGSTFGITLAQ
jgi:peptidoglycan/LPS O-acetylase OafA/YrhL